MGDSKAKYLVICLMGEAVEMGRCADSERFVCGGTSWGLRWLDGG